MDLNSINWLAALAAAVAAFLLGGVWYSPALFGKPWMKASGMTEEKIAQRSMAIVFGVAFVWALLGALCFAAFLGPKPGVAFATGAGFAAGLFWVAGSFGTNYQFEHKPLSLLAINGGYHTVQYALYGLILGLWH
jgi:hypothetical protein